MNSVVKPVISVLRRLRQVNHKLKIVWMQRPCFKSTDTNLDMHIYKLRGQEKTDSELSTKHVSFSQNQNFVPKIHFLVLLYYIVTLHHIVSNRI